MAQSMRFTLSEVMAGMLASIETDGFTDDPVRLAKMFEDLAGEFALFAPLATAVDAEAVAQALRGLVRDGFLEAGDGRYSLTEIGRAHCIRSKRTLFNKGDIEQLEGAALVFNGL